MRALSRVVARLVYQCFMVLLVQHLHNNDNNNNPFFFSRTTQTSLFASSAPLSNPHLNDTTLHLAIPKYFDNKRHFRKFEQSIPEAMRDVPIITLKHKHPQCSISLCNWSTSVGSSVYSTPVISPADKKEKADFINTF